MVRNPSGGAVVTVEYRLYDEHGNQVKTWQENRLGEFVRAKFGKDIQRWPFGKAVEARRDKWQRQ